MALCLSSRTKREQAFIEVQADKGTYEGMGGMVMGWDDELRQEQQENNRAKGNETPTREISQIEI